LHAQAELSTPNVTAPARKTDPIAAWREARLLLILLLIGLLVLPGAIYLVGQMVFGAYDGKGFTDFFVRNLRGFFSGNPVIWFLSLSPYLAWQVLRTPFWFFKRNPGKSDTDSR